MNQPTTNTAFAANSDQAAPATNKARAFAHEAVDQTADKAEVMEEKLRAEAAHAAEKASAGKDQAIEKWDEAVKGVDHFMRQRPVAAAGIAFGAGVVAALLLRR
jgi:ElaB/YqjD/DUF883 family membrane-anchored ribosome-binding protein